MTTYASLTPAMTATSVSVAPSSVASMVAQLNQGVANDSAPPPQMHVTAASAAIIALLLLAAVFGIWFAIWGNLDRAQRWCSCMLGRPNTGRGRGNGNDDDGDGGRSQSLSHEMQPPTVTRSYSVQRNNNCVDLERGVPRRQVRFLFASSSSSETAGESAKPASTSTSTTTTTTTTQAATPLRWPFWPDVANPPVEPAQPENRMVVEALARDYDVAGRRVRFAQGTKVGRVAPVSPVSQVAQAAHAAQVVTPTSTRPSVVAVQGSHRSNGSKRTSSTPTAQTTDRNFSIGSRSGLRRDLTARKSVVAVIEN
ncbi:hypothetical protein SPBR_00888 [Sporothrix brasiliensis 5110]|uniref:Uncharacterized protein n=1 Tax=Sporothrix brasiliensis 5110 TaxID=1398154 RepID=A0A0C2FFR7_9PEZI|nr:uncharacterized protein SPBR_00888 [Sporothrix brasiliensis 5110]KIH89968.1 hypothetical protein SPBR_00888 [Sporothrix brasiliensis 5110]